MAATKGKTRNYLALDLGAESGRGIVGRFDGRKLTLKEVYRFGHTPMRYLDTMRWDVLMMSHHLKQALSAAVEKTRGDLASLAVDTWGVDYVLLDRNDQLLGYPMHYRDPRNYAAMEAVCRKLGRERIFNATGLQFLQFNTLYQLHAERVSGSRLLEAARTLLFIPDFLSYSLGGEKTCEYTIASTSQMLDARRRNWAKSLIKAAGLPTHFLKTPTPPATVTGTVHAAVAAETGASRRLKIVAPGSHDTASAVVAVPTTGGDDWAYLSSGTWSLLGGEEPRPVVTDDVFKLGFTNEGGLDGTIRLLTNIMGLWLVQELRRAWTDKKGQAPDYVQLEAEAERARAFGPIVHPNWKPFGLPGRMDAKIVAFCKGTGQKPPTTRGAFVRCAFESLALAYRDAMVKLQQLRGGRPIGRLHIVGGGSKNLMLNRLTADACGVEVVAGPDEATAMGNLVAQMLADGRIASLAEGRAVVRASSRLKRYRPHDTAPWDDAYATYLKLARKRVAWKD